MSNFDLANIALKSVCPNNEILYDDKGMPSVMVYIPKMTYEQLGLGTDKSVHPAFIVNGKEVDGIYISKYQNIVQNGRAYSLPGQDPRASITFDTALSACTAKGPGWHLMTKQEWAAIALWCKKNDSMPYGNNNWGKDTRETVYKAVPTTFETSSDYEEHKGQAAHVATGTGPLTWSHDGTPSGIWDLNGNVWEWNGGIRSVFGELQVLANNNAADLSNPQTAASQLWMAIDGTTGELIKPNGSGTTTNSLKLQYEGSAWKWIKGTVTGNTPPGDGKGCTFESVTAEEDIGEKAKLYLQVLGLLKYDDRSGAYQSDYFYWNNTQDERMLYSGGCWRNGAAAGVFISRGNYSRGLSSTCIGFRSAFVKLPTV